ncbi:MAG: hypothetical protein SVU94_06305 [Bacteroidota bacterium]|nr:hypothetical protein [Bacteroidota bacterium]
MVCCPLCCNNEPFETVNGIDKKDYRYYRVCKLIFSYPKDLPTLEEERNCYLQHRNGIEDKRYVQFLNQAVIPAMDYLQQGMECLDFGCGPVPTLSIMVKRNGLPYDD